MDARSIRSVDVASASLQTEMMPSLFYLPASVSIPGVEPCLCPDGRFPNTGCSSIGPSGVRGSDVGVTDALCPDLMRCGAPARPGECSGSCGEKYCPPEVYVRSCIRGEEVTSSGATCWLSPDDLRCCGPGRFTGRRLGELGEAKVGGGGVPLDGAGDSEGERRELISIALDGARSSQVLSLRVRVNASRTGPHLLGKDPRGAHQQRTAGRQLHKVVRCVGGGWNGRRWKLAQVDSSIDICLENTGSLQECSVSLAAKIISASSAQAPKKDARQRFGGANENSY